MDFSLPTLEDKAELQGYLDECSAVVEQSVMLNQGQFAEDYPAWVATIESYAKDGNGDWGRSLFLLCRDECELVGLLCIRYELTKELEDIYGHIGYSVRPSKRRRGYATKMLQHALSVCKDLGRDYVTIGCYTENAASSGVIRKCGGVLIDERDSYVEGRMSEYFEIRLA